MVLLFFGLRLRPDAVQHVVPPLNTALRLTQVALPMGETGPATLYAEVDGQQFAVCTLRFPERPQWTADLCFTAQHFVHFSVAGASPLCLTGHYQILQYSEETFSAEKLREELKASVGSPTFVHHTKTVRDPKEDTQTTTGVIGGPPSAKRRKTGKAGDRHVHFAEPPAAERRRPQPVKATKWVPRPTILH